MKKKLITLIPYAIVFAVDFYLLPTVIRDTGMAMLVMLCVIPLFAFIVALVYGTVNGFNIILPVLAMLLFLPTIFIYYNYTAWVYVIAYGVIVLAGNGIGRIFYKRR